jgi:hypothetical protein
MNERKTPILKTIKRETIITAERKKKQNEEVRA